MEHGEVYGEASLAEALRGIKFPITKQDLIDCFGDQQVEVEKDKTMSVHELVSDCPHEKYFSMDDIVKCEAIEAKLKGSMAA
ncbi:MAG: hypothetical protein M1548_07115 [Actinobacteria bacterium]|nr:hypothetical protein [Actinomycetota bacterium]